MRQKETPLLPPGGWLAFTAFMITWSIRSSKLTENPTASIKPPKRDKVLPKYLTAEQSMDLLESTQYQSDFPERDYWHGGSVPELRNAAF